MDVISLYDRIKSLAKNRGKTILDCLEDSGLTLGAYNSQRRKGLFLRSDVLFAISKKLETSMEFLVSGGSAAPPGISPPLRELLSVAEKMTPEEQQKLVAIARICKNQGKDDELEIPPQTKTG